MFKRLIYKQIKYININELESVTAALDEARILYRLIHTDSGLKKFILVVKNRDYNDAILIISKTISNTKKGINIK